MSLNEVQFFGAVDRKERRANGIICSEYPAFYFTSIIDDMEEDIARKERELGSGMTPAAHAPKQKADLEREKARLVEIKNSKIKLTGKVKDEAAKVHKELGGLIQDSMFTRTDSEKGLADAHEELRRQTQPLFNVRGHTQLFHNMGINIKDGKASRNQISKVYKIIGKVLGENTNTERLRPDRRGGTYTEDVPMHRV